MSEVVRWCNLSQGLLKYEIIGGWEWSHSLLNYEIIVDRNFSIILAELFQI